MATSNNTWVIVADGEVGRLLHCGKTELGSAHVEQVDTIEHKPGAYEHAKPSPRAGRTGDPNDDHEDEEESRRFARKLSEWIRRHVETRSVPHMTLFAPPRLLGTLRKITNGKSLPRAVNTKEADLTSLTTEQLTKHQSIRELVRAN